MSALALRPRSSTELVDAAIQVYKREALSFILAAALIYVPWLVIRVAFDVGIDGTTVPGMTQMVVALIGGALVYTFAGGVTTMIASDVYLDRPLDLVRSFRSVGRHVVPLVATMIVVTVLMMVGAVFFLLPALYPISRFFAVRQLILLEGKGTGAALSRSSQLSLGTKRHILSTLLLMFLLTAAISIGGTLLFQLIPSYLVQQVMATALSAVLYPVFGIAETLLYYDIRIRREGFDVEYLASQTPGAGVALPAGPSAASY